MEVPSGSSTDNNVHREGQNGVGVNESSNGSYVIVDSPLLTSSRKSSPEKDSDSSSDSYVQVNHEDTIVDCTLPQLMEKMRSIQYNFLFYTAEELIFPNCNLLLGKNYEIREELIFAKRKLLFEKDYEIETVRNHKTGTYPREIIIPVAKKDGINAKNIGLDVIEYSELVKEARLARLEGRFVAPVILFDDKFICRSGSLAIWFSKLYEAAKQIRSAASTEPSPFTTIPCYSFTMVGIPAIIMDLRFGTDSKIFELLKVEHICDLMVEYDKHYKWSERISATENFHKFYKDIKMEEMPYPGCEFFTKYSEANRKPEGLIFDWNQSHIIRTLKLKEEAVFSPAIDILKFKEWDLVELTANYLKIMLSYLVTSENSMNVPGLLGWDRTSLFISLLRLSLWADGVVHQNLDYSDMAYLTLAYDWFLFGHDLPNKLSKKEEIMHFCFNFLHYITSDDFSVTKMFTELPEEKQRNRQFPNFNPGRRIVLNKVRALVLDTYENIALRPKME